MRLPGAGGLEVVRRLHAERPRLPVVLLTAHGTSESAIEATKRGAFDYLLKPFAIPDLLAVVARALEQTRSDPPAPAPEPAGTGIVGRSRAMQELFKELGRVAPGQGTVLIRGETGSGKELVARALWRHGDRARRPFLALNCAALPETLLESELFGHERGAFTGADARRPGLFEQADGGILLLDEIGDIPPATQVRLLRVLQERTVRRVGGAEDRPVDVRVLAATHAGLESRIAAGTFREDLFYRLEAVRIRVPPLREREGDIPLLVRHFSTRLDPNPPHWREDALARLERHAWPGNVRELENVVRRVLLEARGFDVSASHVERALADALPGATAGPRDLPQLVRAALHDAMRSGRGEAHAATLRVVEAELVREALRLAGGNKSRAARWLGLSRLTLRDKLGRVDEPGP